MEIHNLTDEEKEDKKEMPCGQTAPPGVHTVYFEGCYIVYNGNKRRTKTKETECDTK